MITDDNLAKKVHAQNVDFFASLVPAIRAVLGVDEPFLKLGGSIALFAGEGSPLTQANGDFTADDLDAISEFFHGKASSWEAILTPFAGPEAMQRVLDRGAAVMGWESSLVRPTSEPLPNAEIAPEISIAEAGPDVIPVWEATSRRGFFGDEPNEVAMTLGRIFSETNAIRRYVAYWDGEPAGAASLTPGREIAFLGGMATLPDFRGRGIQTALLRRRLEDAREYGEFALMGAAPGSSSQRNSIRAGFRLVFTQLSLRVPT